jgi:endonuclease/exonuclease/phosphatase family metal-dependent hydrolase
MQGCLSDEVLRVPGTFQSSTALRIVRSIRPCQATADIICLQEVSEAHLQQTVMSSWKVVRDRHTDTAIAYNPATVNVKHGDIQSIKLYNVEHDCRKWRTYLQATLPLLALLYPPPMYRSPPRVYHYLAVC